VAGSGWVLRSAVPPASGIAATGQVLRSQRVDVLRELRHDTSCYTQGLLWWQGKLFESCGQSGVSTLRRVDPVTGEVEQQVDIEPQFFAEGLARVGDRLIMLTYRAQRAFVFGIERFDRQAVFRYAGEGWGLCNDVRRLVMSDGSDRLTFRDPESFEETGGVAVTLRGAPQRQLNELECVDDVVYANVYQREYIVRIDPAAGRITHQIDASGLLTNRELRDADVLNGIAYDPAADTFYITGKWWPKMFEVRFVD
jgi:glutamine cyclotransferase